MSRQTLKIAGIAAASAALTWYVHSLLTLDTATPAAPPAAATPVRSAPPPERPLPASPAGHNPGTPAPKTEIQPPTAARPLAPPITNGQPQGATTPEPRRELAAAAGPLESNPAARSAPLNGLLAAESIRCDFHEGLNITQASNGHVGVGGMAYRGDEVLYQNIDLDSENADMVGRPAGLLEGSQKVRTSATTAGMHFYGFRAKGGEFVVTSVYATKNPAGSYLAVMSVHDTAFQQSAFMTYGSCDVVLTRP